MSRFSRFAFWSEEERAADYRARVGELRIARTVYPEPVESLEVWAERVKRQNDAPDNAMKNNNPTDENNMLEHVFIPPFRVGRKQMRAVLDAKGVEVVIFPKGLECYAKEYTDFLNSTRKNGC